MEVTAQTFLGLAEQWDYKQRLALKTAVGSNRMGLIPGAPFQCKAAFTDNQFEADDLRCMALLPSGRIIDAEEHVQVAIPMLFQEKYYLTVGFSEQGKAYEREGVAYIRPRYNFEIHTREEVENADIFPLLRFHVNSGTVSISQDFIPPCLLLTAEPRFKQYINGFVDKLATITSHAHLVDGDGKRSLLHYMFLLKCYDLHNSMNDFMLFTEEIAQAIDFYILTPHLEQPPTVPTPSVVDIQEWLQWLDDYMAGAATVLDSVELPPVIDYELLLAQAKAELYDKLNPELTQKMLDTMREDMERQIQQLHDDLTNYINVTMKEQLKTELAEGINEHLTKLSDELTEKFEKMGRDIYDSLYEKLYTTLFDNLFNALYVPEPEEEKFIPLI